MCRLVVMVRGRGRWCEVGKDAAVGLGGGEVSGWVWVRHVHGAEVYRVSGGGRSHSSRYIACYTTNTTASGMGVHRRMNGGVGSGVVATVGSCRGCV